MIAFEATKFQAFTLPAGASLTAKVKYSIEVDWDYAYLIYSTDNGSTWIPIETRNNFV